MIRLCMCEVWNVCSIWITRADSLDLNTDCWRKSVAAAVDTTSTRWHSLWLINFNKMHYKFSFTQIVPLCLRLSGCAADADDKNGKWMSIAANWSSDDYRNCREYSFPANVISHFTKCTKSIPSKTWRDPSNCGLSLPWIIRSRGMCEISKSNVALYEFLSFIWLQ